MLLQLETILAFDEAFFSLINQDLANPFLDAIMPYWREKTTWIPLYIVILIVSYLQFSWKKALVFIFLLAGTVGIADQISSQWIKKSVQRSRPCNDPSVKDEVHLLVDCGSGYSFTSSHATNHFAIAFFIAFALFSTKRLWRILLFLWASIIAFGQVYVGVHYPLDVTAGALLGILIGYGILRLFRYLETRRFLNEKVVV
ncbi:MAG: phosphatase PAP2 family protein [Bacteroidota bacterium]